MNHVWCSGATDQTGKLLAEALEATLVKKKPTANAVGNDVLICWGAKTDKAVVLGDIKVLNHPDKIRSNRNKLEALEVVKKKDPDIVAKFVKANEVIDAINRGTITLPLIGRTKFHQGGKGLWTCLTQTHVQKAIAEGADYFQVYIDVETEYRLHVAFGEVIYAQKKVPSENARISWIQQRMEKIQSYNDKNEWKLNMADVERALGVLVKEATLPDHIVKSNKRGWKFSSLNLNNVANDLQKAAIDAVEAIGLDFGAVDCAKSVDGNFWVIEVNSGPGLQGTSFEKYVEAFKAKIKELVAPQPAQRPNPVRRAAPARRRDAGPEMQAEMAVGAAQENAGEEAGMVAMFHAVKTPEEARALIDALMRERNNA